MADNYTSTPTFAMQELYTNYLQALLQGDRRRCQEIITHLSDQELDIRAIYLDFFQKSLYQVGELWETNQISVATEHMATAITEGLLALLYPRLFSAYHSDKTAIVSCCANEYHQIGGKMVADIFELNGWDAHFLGANTPINDLLHFTQEHQPDVVALSLSLYSNLPKLLETTRIIRGNFRDLHIIFGGQAFRWGGESDMSKIARTQFITSLDTLEDSIRI